MYKAKDKKNFYEYLKKENGLYYTPENEDFTSTYVPYSFLSKRPESNEGFTSTYVHSEIIKDSYEGSGLSIAMGLAFAGILVGGIYWIGSHFFGQGQNNHVQNNQGQNNHGQNNHGQNNHGQNNHGQNNHGQNNHGQNNHGQNNHGQNNHGQDNHRQSNSSPRQHPPQPKREQQTVQPPSTSQPPTTCDYSYIVTLSVADLRQILKCHGVDSSDCIEKREIVERVLGVVNEKYSFPPSKNTPSFQTSTEGDVCIICMDKKRNVLFLECGHEMCCMECGERLEDCPVCRRHISRVVKVFK